MCPDLLAFNTPLSPNDYVGQSTKTVAVSAKATQSTLRLEGIWVPLITPFKNGHIDISALQNLVALMVKSGVHGLVACGTTGEAAHLSELEQETVLSTILASVKPDYPVLMGISGSDTLSVVKKIAHFNQFNIAGFLVSAPSYVKPSQDGIILHFQAIACASSHPIIIYNIPSRTGVNIDLPTLKTLAAIPQFAGIKESSGNMRQIVDIFNHTTLQVLSGDDTLLLNTLCAGGVGAISAAAHIRPDLYVYLYNLVNSGYLIKATTVFNMMLPLIRLLFLEPNPAPVKAVLALQGRISEELRLPMIPVEMAFKEKLQAALAKIDLNLGQVVSFSHLSD